MVQRLQPYRVEPLGARLRRPADRLFRADAAGLAHPPRGVPGAAVPGPARPGPRASPGSRARRWKPCPRPARPCAARRSPGWPTRSTHWCCRSRARVACGSWMRQAPRRRCAGICRHQRPAVRADRPLAARAGPGAGRLLAGIKAWVAQNPQRLQETDLAQSAHGVLPRGAAVRHGWRRRPARGAGRGADAGALDRGGSRQHSVWHPGLAGLQRPVARPCSRLVLAQDTGSAIVGAVRADYFVGWGPQAGEVAGRLKQPLQLWVLWPK
jgi:membrane-bound lytic murein transglycosylase A